MSMSAPVASVVGSVFAFHIDEGHNAIAFGAEVVEGYPIIAFNQLFNSDSVVAPFCTPILTVPPKTSAADSKEALTSSLLSFALS